jgi:hypothetical protein
MSKYFEALVFGHALSQDGFSYRAISLDHGVHQQALRVDKDMTLLAFDFLARVIPARVDAAPPFSALFTL